MSGAQKITRSLGVLSAAAGASFAGAAHAGPVSTAPAGFSPVTITGGVGATSYNIDLDMDGQSDLTINGGLQKGPFVDDARLNSPNSNAVFPMVMGTVQAFASPADFIDISGIGGGSNSGFLSDFSAATPYGEIGLIANAAVGQIGYIKGVANTSDGSFLLEDFGLIETPEPASLSLLALGVAGLASFRRRRAAAQPN